MTEFAIGLDEVGRGALAGPVVTGAIILSNTHQFNCEVRNNIPSWKINGITIRDSKLLSPLQRERANEWLIANSASHGIGVGSVVRINKWGIIKATNFAFRSAIKQATTKGNPLPHKLLIDAFFVPNVENYPKQKQEAIVHGDRLILEIAAASIIAKVYRDTLMKKLSVEEEYTEYLWQKNKGYGTKAHIQAIKKFGTTKQHRLLFIRKIVA